MEGALREIEERCDWLLKAGPRCPAFDWGRGHGIVIRSAEKATHILVFSVEQKKLARRLALTSSKCWPVSPRRTEQIMSSVVGGGAHPGSLLGKPESPELASAFCVTGKR